MRIPRKTLILIVCVFIIRVVQSCCSCGEDPIAFDFEEVSVRNLDNSGSYVTRDDNNTMYAKAIAFEVDISGIYLGCLNSNKHEFGFAEAVACDCSPAFSPNQEISKITIITLNAVSPGIPADTDVTDLFLAHSPADNNPSSYLYLEIENIYGKINRTVYSDSPSTSFQIFCTEEVMNSVAQFSVTIELSDGRILTAISEIISVLPDI